MAKLLLDDALWGIMSRCSRRSGGGSSTPDASVRGMCEAHGSSLRPLTGIR